MRGFLLLNYSRPPQAEDASVGTYVQNHLGTLRQFTPLAERLLLCDVRAKEIELPLQHFAEITIHLVTTIFELGTPDGTICPSCMMSKQFD